MNKKRIISLVLLVIGVILLIIGLFGMFDNSTESTDKDKKDEEVIDPSLASVIDMAYQLYGGEGKKVKVDDEKERYVIYVSDASTNKLLNTFYMDKETMVITEKPIVIEQSASS